MIQSFTPTILVLFTKSWRLVWPAIGLISFFPPHDWSWATKPFLFCVSVLFLRVEKVLFKAVANKEKNFLVVFFVGFQIPFIERTSWYHLTSHNPIFYFFYFLVFYIKKTSHNPPFLGPYIECQASWHQFFSHFFLVF